MLQGEGQGSSKEMGGMAVEEDGCRGDHDWTLFVPHFKTLEKHCIDYRPIGIIP